MNRIQPGKLMVSDPSTTQSSAVAANVELAVAESPQAFCYSVCLPVHFERHYTYPLVLWLHGQHGDHRELTEVMSAISDRNYIGVSLCGPRRLSRGGFGWIQTPDEIERVTGEVTRLLSLAEMRFGINRRRVFVAGTGSGGTMAQRLAFLRPDLFRGVGSFDGPFPRQLNPLANLRGSRRVPVYLAQHRDSATLSESDLCRQLRLLHVAGFHVSLRQYPARNTMPTRPFADFDTWIMEQLSTQPDSGIVL